MTHVPGIATVRPTVRSAAAPFRPRLTYAITPPNQTTPDERRRAIAAAQSARVSSLPVDALLVYDVQDEAARNGNPRPFSFVPKVDPLSYAFDELQIGALPRVVYRAVAEQSEGLGRVNGCRLNNRARELARRPRVVRASWDHRNRSNCSLT